MSTTKRGTSEGEHVLAYKEISREEAIALKALGVLVESSYNGVAWINWRHIIPSDMSHPKYRVQVDV